MPPLEYLSLLLGASFASGLNLYASVATLGLLDRFGVIHLPASLGILSHPLVLGVAITLYVLEFFADKIPYLDNVWDAIHTFIRPAAAALLAYGLMSPVAPEWRIVAALCAGGVALISHGTKATARLAVNASPEPFSNSLLSLAEDGIAITLVWMATKHPILTTMIATLLLAFSFYLLWKFFRLVRRAIRWIFGKKPSITTPPLPA
ncbi:MAG: DUF4126 domain-containing protein [Candidatus Acidiferrales bacterium]